MGLFLVVLLLLPGAARAADPWTTRDTVLQGTVISLMWVDYRQTLDIATGRHQNIYETNAMMGKSPTRRDVNRYFIAYAVSNTALAVVLSKDLRLGWQAVTIGMELSCINNNYRLGVAIRF